MSIPNRLVHWANSMISKYSAHYINPLWVALDASRGIESAESKLFMRTTVVVLDALVYVPALLMFSRTWQASRSKRTQVLDFFDAACPKILSISAGVSVPHAHVTTCSATD